VLVAWHSKHLYAGTEESFGPVVSLLVLFHGERLLRHSVHHRGAPMFMSGVRCPRRVRYIFRDGPEISLYDYRCLPGPVVRILTVARALWLEIVTSLAHLILHDHLYSPPQVQNGRTHHQPEMTAQKEGGR
jgi:hypothetical protein